MKRFLALLVSILAIAAPPLLAKSSVPTAKDYALSVDQNQNFTLSEIDEASATKTTALTFSLANQAAQMGAGGIVVYVEPKSNTVYFAGWDSEYNELILLRGPFGGTGTQVPVSTGAVYGMSALSPTEILFDEAPTDYTRVLKRMSLLNPEQVTLVGNFPGGQGQTQNHRTTVQMISADKAFVAMGEDNFDIYQLPKGSDQTLTNQQDLSISDETLQLVGSSGRLDFLRGFGNSSGIWVTGEKTFFGRKTLPDQAYFFFYYDLQTNVVQAEKYLGAYPLPLGISDNGNLLARMGSELVEIDSTSGEITSRGNLFDIPGAQFFYRPVADSGF